MSKRRIIKGIEYAVLVCGVLLIAMPLFLVLLSQIFRLQITGFPFRFHCIWTILRRCLANRSLDLLSEIL